MPVRIYDIAKQLGIESKEVLAKAKELGIASARVPSSSLDKITAEFLEGHFTPAKPASPIASPLPAPEPITLVTAPPPPPEAPPEAPPALEVQTTPETPVSPAPPPRVDTPPVSPIPMVEA